jgi:exonuclease III
VEPLNISRAERERITVITAYQVVNKPITKGQYNVAAQQYTMMLRQSDPLKDPRKAFQRDLTEFLTNITKTGHSIILAGDFNERLGEVPASMSTIVASQFELVDIMNQQHQHLNEPATYARGRMRLDFILVSPALAQAVN